jgi:hypothetical protein
LFVAQIKSTSFSVFVQSKYSKNVVTTESLSEFSCQISHHKAPLLGIKESISSTKRIESGLIFLRKVSKFLAESQIHFETISLLDKV